MSRVVVTVVGRRRPRSGWTFTVQASAPVFSHLRSWNAGSKVIVLTTSGAAG